MASPQQESFAPDANVPRYAKPDKVKLERLSELFQECMAAGDRESAYEVLLLKGETPAWAYMCAYQAPPAIKTNGTFIEGLGQQWGNSPAMAKCQVEMTRKYLPNFSPAGMRWYGGLARFQGDPEAWVPEHDARHTVKRRCEERGWVCEDLGVKGREAPPDKPYRVCDNLVAAEAAKMRAENPKLSKGESLEAAREKITPPDIK